MYGQNRRCNVTDGFEWRELLDNILNSLVSFEKLNKLGQILVWTVEALVLV